LKKLLIYTLFLLGTTTFYAQIQTYYSGLDFNKTGNALFLELSEKLIETHAAIPYTGSPTDVWDACKQADEDPSNAANVLLIYGFDDTDGNPSTDKTRNKNLQDSGGSNLGVWNREHVFAKSLTIPTLGTDSPGPGTDVHNLRPADKDRNSARSSRYFTESSGVNSKIISFNGGWYPGDEWKGDVARIIMYMYTRYHGDGTKTSETKCLPVNIGVGAKLAVDPNMVDLFLKWNAEDPVSDFEANRNEVLASIQGNRNPYIDNPYLATLIWGGLAAEDKWNMASTADTENPTQPTNLVASNITDTSADISWTVSTDNIAVYEYLIYGDGDYLASSSTNSTTLNNLNSETTYQITIKARDAYNNFSESSEALAVTTLVGPKILFEEDFSNCNDLKFFSYNEASTKNWVCEPNFGENNSGSIGINGYQQDVLSKDWLITTNPINFDENEGELLSFYTDAAYGSSSLELLYSINYDGASNPANFNWSAVPNVTIPIKSNTSSNEEVFLFSNVDISSITGTVYIAFKYYSNDAPTRWTVDSFKIVADQENNEDVDNDGVLNENDLCPNTPTGETVDANGCSNGQLDDDNDGVKNSDDDCNNTPIGEDVNASGCSESQLDDDDDGVMNNIDTCPNTPTGETVDANGCSNGQLDDDTDGVKNSEDDCNNTPIGEDVNASGCSESQLDDDNDGVMNNVDTCSNTPVGEDVDANGCSESQLDDDSDGVMNNVDACPNTTAGVEVDAQGCFTLDATNFSIEVISETCANKGNGKVNITALASYNYVASINGSDYDFTSTKTIEGLAAGIHEVCIAVKTESFTQCFTVEIKEGGTISGKSSLNSKTLNIEIENGTPPFTVFVNGNDVYKTSFNIFNVDVNHGDLVEVKTSVSCEGVLSQKVEMFNETIAYPNPTKGMVFINLDSEKSTVLAEVYNSSSTLIFSKQVAIKNGKLKFDLSNQPTGIYFIKVISGEPKHFKVIKN